MNRGYEKREASPSQKIYISNLSIDTTEDDLRKAFGQYGSIVEVILKKKDAGIVFGFVEFSSTEEAEKAVDSMNGATLQDKSIKVEFAKGYRERDNRGGDRGDRGGFRGGRDFDRRGPREDRPKGCFNCQQEGHFAKECPNPRQPREFNRDRNDSRGGYRGSSNRDSRDYRGGERRDRDRSRDRDNKRRKESSDSSRSPRKRKQKRRGSSQSN